MMGSQKSKRVSWASDAKLCQVKLFLSEDSPSQVGLGGQDLFQAKTSFLLHSTGAGSDDHLPPGFEGGAHSASQPKQEVSQIPLVKWQCPRRFSVNPHWQVVAGQESKEIEIQNQREMRVLEAVYPRPSAIPPSPSVPLESENIPCDDRQTPLIPVTPIEDEDSPDPSFNSVLASPQNPSMSKAPLVSQNGLGPGVQQISQYNMVIPPNKPNHENSVIKPISGVEPDAAAAAAAAFTAIMKSQEQGSLIDHELLIKILNDPKLVEELVTGCGIIASNANPQAMTPKPRSPPRNFSHSQSGSLPVQMNTSVSTLPPTGHFYPVKSTGMHPPPSVPPPPPPPPGRGQISTAPLPVKDMNYYKSLIQQHGGERAEAEDQYRNQLQPQFGANEETLYSSNQRDQKMKIMKPCMYFNSSRGCHRGAHCVYQHDSSPQQRTGSLPETQSAKRMKVDREITGRT